jgi:hypothetical protein
VPGLPLKADRAEDVGFGGSFPQWEREYFFRRLQLPLHLTLKKAEPGVPLRVLI